MVSYKKSFFVYLILVASCLRAEETFVEAKPKKTTLSKARQEAVEQLEILAHDLTKEIEAASCLLRDVMQSARGVIEGDKNDLVMKRLAAERGSFVSDIANMNQETRKRTDALRGFRIKVKK